MPKRWNRLETWLTLVVVGIGGGLALLGGLWMFMSATATPLHPDAARVPSTAAGPSPAHWANTVTRARELVRAAMAEQNVPGLSVAVGVDDQIVWAEGFGWADLDARAPVAPDTRFRIGTASAVLTSAAAGLLLEQDRLRLDAAIREYVPAFPEKPWPVTLRQVMAHVSGLRSDGGDEGPLFGVHCERPVDALEHFASRPLLFEPGTQMRISNFGWIVVSAAIERVTREPFLGFMRSHVFDALGMADTRADEPGAAPPAMATSYFPRFAADPRYGPDPMRPVDYSCYAGASVFVSTTSDLVRFGMALASGRLLKPDTLRVLQAPQRLASGEETGHGLGWDLRTTTLAGTPVRATGADGQLLGGMMASLLTFPDHHLVVAVTSNISYTDTFALGSRVADAFAAGARPLDTR